MKLSNLIKSTILVASIALIPGIASAQQINTTSTSQLKPFNAAFLAYQGALKQQGIPSGSALIFEYQIKNLTAVDVVKAAVNANKLSPEVLNDEGYLSAVDSQLTSLANSLSYGGE